MGWDDSHPKAVMTGSLGNRAASSSKGAPLRLDRLVKHYGVTKAVDDVSLEVAASEFVSLLGPSGSGKTTTLMMVAGFAVPDQGGILLGDDNITRLAPYRRNIGMVHQSYALFPHMTVGRNVAFPLRMRRMARHEIAARVTRALELVRLTGMTERLPAQLSGGQQQRVALARALVFEPPLLLMDEPLGALDKKLRVELQVEIKRIQRESGSTMIYVTHDQEEALSMSDRVVVMNHGRIEQVGPPQELYDRPRSRFVADFLGASNFIPVWVVAPGDPMTVRTDGGLTFSVPARAVGAAGDRLTASIRPERIRLDAVPDPGSVTARGSVFEASYFGNSQRYQVRLESGDVIAVVWPSTGAAMYEIGSPVEVSWGTADVWMIPETNA
jgi:spermidine/putrescine ABC transporter ATP-binding subunit